MNEIIEENQDICQPMVAEMLIGRASPELILLYLELLQTLHLADFNGHIEEVDLLHSMLSSQSIGTDEVTESVDTIIRTSYARCFSMIGVSISDDIPLDLLCELAEGILLYDTTDTPEYLLNAIDASEDADEAFLKVLEYRTVREIEEWMPYILEVNPACIDRMRKLAVEGMNNKASANIEIDSMLARRLSRLNALKKDTLGSELIKQGSAVGASLESLYGLYVGKLMDQPLEDSVDDLYSLATLSCESITSAQAGVSTWLDDLCYDVDQRRKAEQISLRLSKEYSEIFGE